MCGFPFALLNQFGGVVFSQSPSFLTGCPMYTGGMATGFNPPPLFTINFSTLIEHVAGRRRILHDGWWANRSGVRLRACRDRPTGVAVCPSYRPVLISQRCGQRRYASPPLRGRQSAGYETDRRQVTTLCVDRGNTWLDRQLNAHRKHSSTAQYTRQREIARLQLTQYQLDAGSCSPVAAVALSGCFHLFACGSNRMPQKQSLLRPSVVVMSPGPVAHLLACRAVLAAGGCVQCCKMPSRIRKGKDGKCNITQGGTGTEAKTQVSKDPRSRSLCIFHPCVFLRAVWTLVGLKLKGDSENRWCF